ncbi:MAG: RluA family pseudouridine synthase [Rhodothermales bacterium]
MEPDVLFMDNHVLVVNKPPGMLVQGDVTGDVDLLTIGKQYVKKEFGKPGEVFLGLVHRLDRPASGVMVFARTSKAASRLSTQFRTRTIEKDYLAIVEGRLVGEGAAVDHLRQDHRYVRVVESTAAGAQQASMQWRALGHEDDLTLVSVRLESGRKHQIRVQLSAMGYPILGDFRYRGTRELDGRNIALHCFRLGFEHPTTKERMVFTAPPPATWGARFHGAIGELGL